MITHTGPIRTREVLGSLAEPRSAARCTAEDCEENTSERKPYCHRHVFLMPYVQALPHVRASRGERVAVPPEDRDEVRDAAGRLRGSKGGRYGAPALQELRGTLGARAVAAPALRRVPGWDAPGGAVRGLPVSDQDLERAKRTLRTYGIPFGESLHPCGHGCAGGDRVTSGPIAHAGDLWMLEACGRCLLGRATRHEPGLPIPLPLVRPTQLWLRHAHGSAHRVFLRFRPAPGRPPEVEGAPTPLLTACGHAYGWPSEPVWSIRHAFDQGTIWRCRLCASARRHLAAVEADQALVWDELLRRAQVALDEAGHPVPWERVS